LPRASGSYLLSLLLNTIMKSQKKDHASMNKRAKCTDTERILMGAELCDIEINFAQQLLKQQFTDLNDKKLQITESSVQNKLQIVHCKKKTPLDSCHSNKLSFW